MNNMRNKILSLLVLLLTAASGAWAEETPLVTITFDSNGPVYSVEGIVTLTGTNYVLGSSSGVYFWSPNSATKTLSATVEAVSDNVSISKVVFWGFVSDYVLPLEDTEKPFVCYANVDKGGRSLSETDWTNNVAAGERIAKIDVYAGPAEAPITVEWNASTKTGTFAMPGSDVVLTPQYAPAAKWDVVENVEQLPAALEGIIAGQDAAIVTPGQSAQGTVMYAVTPSAEAAPALTAFSATVPTAKTYDDATTLYVWYYIQGQDTPDGQQATEENTFNDSEISATPLKVDILTNKFDLTLSPAPVKNMTVTVAGQAKTPDQEGKVEAVKMQSEVKLKAATGYKFRKVEVKKGAAEAQAEVGQIIGSDGKSYDANATLPDGVTAVAVIAYVGSETYDATFKNGLAIALADEAQSNWSTAMSTCEGKTAITGAKWCLPSQDQWKQMFKATGSNEGSYTGLNTTITNAGGTALRESGYWSSSEYNPGVRAYFVALGNGSADWRDGLENLGRQVRACLAF